MPPLPFFTDSLGHQLEFNIHDWHYNHYKFILPGNPEFTFNGLFLWSPIVDKMFDLWFRFVVSLFRCFFLSLLKLRLQTLCIISNKIIINYNQPQLKLKSAVLNTLQSSVVTNTNAGIFIHCNSSCSSQRCEQNTEFLSATFLVSKIMHYPLARVWISL